MEVRYRNAAEVRFGPKSIVAEILNMAKGGVEMGWLLDSSQFDEGIEIDEEGITLHLCKYSDKQETFDQRKALLVALNVGCKHVD